MKITNMSSGKVAVEMAKHFVEDGYDVTLLLTKGIKNPMLDKLENSDNFESLIPAPFRETPDEN